MLMGAYGNGKDPKRGKKATTADEGEYGDAFRGYINLNLTDEQKEGFDAWVESQAYWEAFEFFCSDGVSLSVKRNPRDGNYLSSAVQRRTASENYGLAVTCRASSASKALGRLLFTLTILSHSARWEDVQPLADPDRW
jgi:hypothetical protein